jgi:hypothetical protein
MVAIKDIFGKVGEGIHSYRILDVAIADVLMTILGALIIKLVLAPKYHFFIILTALFISGIIIHRVLGVRTTVDKWLFVEIKEKRK